MSAWQWIVLAYYALFISIAVWCVYLSQIRELKIAIAVEFITWFVGNLTFVLWRQFNVSGLSVSIVEPIYALTDLVAFICFLALWASPLTRLKTFFFLLNVLNAMNIAPSIYQYGVLPFVGGMSLENLYWVLWTNNRLFELQMLLFIGVSLGVWEARTHPRRWAQRQTTILYLASRLRRKRRTPPR